MHLWLFLAESAKCEEESRHIADGDGECEHAGEGGTEPEPCPPEWDQTLLFKTAGADTGTDMALDSFGLECDCVLLV